MGVQLATPTASGSARSTFALRIITSLIATALLLWSIRFGYEAANEPRYGLWVSGVGVLIMVFGFLLVALGLPIIADLFLMLLDSESEEVQLQYPQKTIYLSSGNLKVDVSV